nr:mat [Erythrotrichia welwitschii]
MLKNYTESNPLDLTSYLRLNNLSWSIITKYVNLFQKQIYELSSIGDSVQVRKMQKQLFNDENAILLAIRHLSNRNVQYQIKSSNSKSDFLFFNASHSLHMDYINKIACDNVTIDLVLQELLLIILRPEWEARIEPNSYCLSSKLATNQAVIKTYSILSENASYIDSTIFVGRLHNWLDELNTPVILKKGNYGGDLKENILLTCTESLISLSANLLNKNFQSTDIIVFAHNSIVTLLINILLYGLEKVIEWRMNSFYGYSRKRNLDKVMTIVLSNHFLIVFPDNNLQHISLIVNTVRSFFQSAGLELENSSLNVNSIHDGFDFLGFNFKRYANNHTWNDQETKLIIRPTNSNIKKHLLSMRYCLYHKDRLNRWRANAQMTQYDVINRLNPLIKNFSQYYQDIVPVSSLRLLDRTLNEVIYRYAVKKYKSDRSKKWDSNWTAIVNGKKVIAYKNETKLGYHFLYLHIQKYEVKG